MILFAFIISILFVIGLKTPSAGVFSKDIVTVLKPFLAIGVVLHHLHRESVWLYEFERWGPLIVGVFFFISGYGLTWSYRNKRIICKSFFIDKVIIKLSIPFLLALCLSMCIDKSWAIYSIMDKLTFSGGPYLFANDWFLYVLIYCYIAFMMASSAKSDLHSLLILVIAPALLVFITGYMGYARNWWATPMAFTVGVFYCYYEKVIRKTVDGRKRYIVSMMISLCLLAVIIGVSALYKTQSISTVLAYSLLPLLVINIMIRLDVRSLAKNKLIMFGGGISFEIYLVHGIIIDFMRGTLYLSGPTLIVSVLMVTLIVACLFKQLSLMCQKGIGSIRSHLSAI